jgi:hypothetical protein
LREEEKKTTKKKKRKGKFKKTNFPTVEKKAGGSSEKEFSVSRDSP